MPLGYPLDELDAVHIPDDFSFDKSYFMLPETEVDFIQEILIPEGLIKSRIEKLAQKIYKDYCG